MARVERPYFGFKRICRRARGKLGLRYLGSCHSRFKRTLMRSADHAGLAPVPPEDSAVDLAAANRVLDYAAEAIKALGGSLDGEFSRAVELILGAKGRVIVSGMGKSGL